MRNYVILNGIKSNTVRGLLIQTLPPISKPLIRTQIDEIDGRDGDIVTKLGYSAYDKSFDIGLYGNYDINEVISFFNSEGVVTFSNEPDKQYRYQVIEAIDFERLIRFRTATATLHVQPFKFSTVEKPLTFTPYIANDFLGIASRTMTSNGITSVSNGTTISVYGTSTGNYANLTGRYTKVVRAGTYTFSIGQALPVPLRLRFATADSPDAFTFTIPAGETSVTVSLTADTINHYLFVSTVSGTAYEFDLTPILSQLVTSFSISNAGNIASRPTITVYGSGTVDLYVNNYQLFRLDITNGFITIDSSAMEAYSDTGLENRNVTGDYDNLKLNIGSNVISWGGSVTQVVISDYSRWL